MSAFWIIVIFFCGGQRGFWIVMKMEAGGQLLYGPDSCMSFKCNDVLEKTNHPLSVYVLEHVEPLKKTARDSGYFGKVLETLYH